MKLRYKIAVGFLIILAVALSSLALMLSHSAACVPPSVTADNETLMAKMNGEDLATLGELMQDGKVTPVIDRRYPLNEVPAAIHYSEKGRARGKIIITLDWL